MRLLCPSLPRIHHTSLATWRGHRHTQKAKRITSVRRRDLARLTGPQSMADSDGCECLLGDGLLYTHVVAVAAVCLCVCVCVGRPWIAMVEPGQDPSSSPRSVERLHGALSSKFNGQTASVARPLAFLPPCSPPPPVLLPLSIPIRERRHRHGFVQF